MGTTTGETAADDLIEEQMLQASSKSDDQVEGSADPCDSLGAASTLAHPQRTQSAESANPTCSAVGTSGRAPREPRAGKRKTEQGPTPPQRVGQKTKRPKVGQTF
jgi:hypothetical protein